MSMITKSLLPALALLLTFFCLNVPADHVRFKGTSAAGNKYEIIIENETPDVMKPLPVRLVVTDATGAAITGARIFCSLTMPAMAMPMNTPTIKETDTPGEYASTFLLTMGGVWVAEMTTTLASGEVDTVRIPIPDIRMPGQEGGVDAKLEELFHEKGNKKK